MVHWSDLGAGGFALIGLAALVLGALQILAAANSPTGGDAMVKSGCGCLVGAAVALIAAGAIALF